MLNCANQLRLHLRGGLTELAAETPATCFRLAERVHRFFMKKGILLAAFGAGNVQSESTLKLFDAEVRGRFPEIPVRWAFTSVLLRERLAAARKKTDSVRKALEKMWFEKYTHVAVQPLQIIPGNEYAEVLGDVGAMRATQGRPGFAKAAVGRPLLADDDDVLAAARAVIAHVPDERLPGEAVVLMGHGAHHAAVARYEDLARAVHQLDAAVHVGTMNGAVTLEDILPRLRSLPGDHLESQQKTQQVAEARVWLMPLLSVVGRHALSDMAGSNPQSWRSRIESVGCRCEPVLKGTAEYAAFIDIWLDHLEEAVNTLA